MLEHRAFDRRALCRCAALAIGLSAAHAHAAPASIDIGQFRPPATAGGILGLDSAFVTGHIEVAGSIFFDYANRPLMVSANGKSSSVVGDQIELQAAVSIALWNRLELGLVMPGTIYQSGGADVDGSHAPTAAAGDLRIEAKLRLATLALGKRSSIGFGLALGLGLPTGTDASYTSSDGVSFLPRVMVSLRVPRVEVFAELGVTLRSAHSIGDLDVGQAMTYGVGLRVAAVRGLGFEGTLTGSGPLSGTTGQRGSPLEFLVGPDYRFARLPFVLVAAAGRGLTDGYGSPNARVVIALRWQARPKPRPVEHHESPVPTKPVLARETPLVETVTPPVVETVTPPVVETVTPPVVETVTPPNAGVNDAPEKDSGLAVLTETGIEIRRQVFFEQGRATLSPDSFPVLAAVGEILTTQPRITRVRIEGHTDNHGVREANVRLSQARAEAVLKYLVEAQYIDLSRLVAVGFGPDQPIADNRTGAGRAKNRRVVFVIDARSDGSPPAH
jgi:OmpA-OmpF porin, OOP family